MNSEIKKIDNFQYEISIEASSEEFNKSFDAVIKKEANMLSVPGFRKGKVPPQMIRRMYGEILKKDFSDDILNILFWEEAIAKKLVVLKAPKVLKFEYQPDNSVSFTVSYESYTPPEQVEYKGLELEKNSYSFAEKTIEKNLEEILIKNAKPQPAEMVDGKLFDVNVSSTLSDEHFAPLPDSKSEDLNISLHNPNLNKNFYNLLQQKKVGDEVEYTDVHFHTHEHDHNESETTENEDADHKHEHKQYYKIKINSINQLILPSLTDEFCKTLSKGKIENAEEYRKSVEENIRKNYDSMSEYLLQNAIMTKLVEANEFDIPESLVDRYVENFIEGEKAYMQGIEITDEMKKNIRESRYDEFKFTAKWHIIREKILETEKIELTDEDFSKEAEIFAEKTGVTFDKALQYAKKSENTRTNLSNKKFFTLIESYSSVTVKNINLDEEGKTNE